MKEKLLTIILILLVITPLILSIVDDYRKEKRYKTTINTLTAMEPQYVTLFRIYPRVIRPVETPINFKAPDPLIDTFFQSLTDLRSYKPSHDTVASRYHSWFLEVATGDTMIQIELYIPSGKGHVVAGELEKFGNGNTVFYGAFQSQKLFQWYQTYSHRWLEAGSK